MNIYGLTIEAYKTKYGLSYRDMAEKLGVSHQAIKYWKEGTHKPRERIITDAIFDAPDDSWQYSLAIILLELLEAGSKSFFVNSFLFKERKELTKKL